MSYQNRLLLRLGQLCDTLPIALRKKSSLTKLAGKTKAGDMRFHDAPDTKLRFLIRNGMSHSVVFVTDPPVPIELYEPLLQTLHPDYQVTIFEMPGYQGSLPATGFQFSFENAVRSTEHFLQSLSGGPHILVFPCVLGFIAIALAHQRPDLVKAVVAPQMPDWQGAQIWKQGRDPKGVLSTPIFGQLMLTALKRKRIQQWYDNALGKKELLTPFVEATITNFNQGGCFCLASGFQNALSEHQGLLSTFDGPALSVWGTADPSHAMTNPQHSRHLLSNATLFEWKDCGHFPELENPKRFSKILDEFISTKLGSVNTH